MKWKNSILKKIAPGCTNPRFFLDKLKENLATISANTHIILKFNLERQAQLMTVHTENANSYKQRGDNIMRNRDTLIAFLNITSFTPAQLHTIQYLANNSLILHTVFQEAVDLNSNITHSLKAIVKYNNALVNQKDANNQTPLEVAVANENDPKFCILLINLGASYSLSDKSYAFVKKITQDPFYNSMLLPIMMTYIILDPKMLESHMRFAEFVKFLDIYSDSIKDQKLCTTMRSAMLRRITLANQSIDGMWSNFVGKHHEKRDELWSIYSIFLNSTGQRIPINNIDDVVHFFSEILKLHYNRNYAHLFAQMTFRSELQKQIANQVLRKLKEINAIDLNAKAQQVSTIAYISPGMKLTPIMLAVYNDNVKNLKILIDVSGKISVPEQLLLTALYRENIQAMRVILETTWLPVVNRRVNSAGDTLLDYINRLNCSDEARNILTSYGAVTGQRLTDIRRLLLSFIITRAVGSVAFATLTLAFDTDLPELNCFEVFMYFYWGSMICNPISPILLLSTFFIEEYFTLPSLLLNSLIITICGMPDLFLLTATCYPEITIAAQHTISNAANRTIGFAQRITGLQCEIL